MAEQLLEHFGADSLDACLADAGRDPVWMADVIAQREREAILFWNGFLKKAFLVLSGLKECRVKE